MAMLADPKLDFPFYFPTLRVAAARATSGTEPRIYTHQATRPARSTRPTGWSCGRRGVGEYYGVQGMNWKAPPILDDPTRPHAQTAASSSSTTTARRLRLVAWRTKKAVYWVSNTLTQASARTRCSEIAGSLERLKQ